MVDYPIEPGMAESNILDCTPSLFSGNLVSNIATNIVSYAHVNLIKAYDWNTKSMADDNMQMTSEDSDDLSNAITSIKFINVPEPRLVVCSSEGTKIYNERAGRLLKTFPKGQGIQYHKACTCVQSGGATHLLIGQSNGAILVVAASNNEFYEVGEIPSANPPKGGVADLCWVPETQLLVVLDELGFVRGYRLDNNGNYIIDHSIEFQFPDEVPVRCASLGPFVIAAFNSGKLRVWHTVTWSQAEVFAHARCITGLDVLPESGYIATVGEDTVCTIFHLSADGRISVVNSAVVKDQLLTGVAFIPWGSGYRACCSSYESDRLTLVEF